MQGCEGQAVFFGKNKRRLTVIHGLEIEGDPGGMELPCLGPELQAVVPVRRQRGHVTLGEAQVCPHILIDVSREIDAAGNRNKV